MASAALNRKALAMVPLDAGANEFGVLRVDSDATHRATQLPAAWAGRLVRFNVLTASRTVDIACSRSSAAEVDGAVAPANNAVSAKVGTRLSAGFPEQLMLPNWDKTETIYLVHEASADNTTLEVMLLK